MEIEIDIASPVPVYEQIVYQVEQHVLNGVLTAGSSMPAIRQLAGDLELNHNTVAKAYKQLESQHVIITAGRRGAFIHQKAIEYIAQNQSQHAQFQLDELVSSLLAKGIHKVNIRDLLKKQIIQLKE